MSDDLPQRPTTAAEMADLIGACAATQTQIRLAGSDSLPLSRFDSARPIQVISTLRMNKIIEHAVADMTVIVQAGMSLEALQRQLAWQNQWLPVDPPACRGRTPGQRTIGGLIATNSLGPLRFGSGDWRLLVMGTTWIDGTGALIKGGGRTVKNVAGYSTPRMLIGSCASLGAIAEVTLRTFARPADEQCVIFFAGTAQRAEEVVAQVLLAPTTPAYIEAVGGRTFATNPLDLPTMNGGVAIAVGFLDRPQSCAAQIEILRALPAAKGLESISQTAAQAGRLRLWFTCEPAPAQGAPALGARIHTLSSHVCTTIAGLESAAAQAGGSAWAVSEAATGVVRTLITASDPLPLLTRVAQQNGNGLFFITHESQASSIPLSDPVPSDNLVQRIKQQLDPANLFGVAPW